MRYALMTTSAWSLCVLLAAATGYAKVAAVPAEDKVFLLRSAGEPSVVIHKNAATENEGPLMRMPDLGGQGGDHVSDHVSEHSQRGPAGHSGAAHGGAKASAKSVIKHVTTEPAIQSAKPMIFTKTKISGKVRLPRVRFARVGVPMELRDEMPSLDFTEKSLVEGGF